MSSVETKPTVWLCHQANDASSASAGSGTLASRSARPQSAEGRPCVRSLVGFLRVLFRGLIKRSGSSGIKLDPFCRTWREIEKPVSKFLINSDLTVTGGRMKTALVTGAAGFIGSFVCRSLLRDGWRVIGLDCMSDYYDVSLKEARESRLLTYNNYRSVHDKIETPELLMGLFKQERPDVVIHLAAQAGVRYSIENPRSYLESNIVGTFELLEAGREHTRQRTCCLPQPVQLTAQIP